MDVVQLKLTLLKPPNNRAILLPTQGSSNTSDHVYHVCVFRLLSLSCRKFAQYAEHHWKEPQQTRTI